MSIQRDVAAVLDAVLNEESEEPAGYIVRGYSWAPDGAEPEITYVSVIRTEIAPSSAAAGARRHDLQIVIMATKSAPGEADDAIDAALDAVLDVIDNDQQLRGLVWERAERGVIAETYPAYTISGWVGTNQEQELT